MTTAPHSDYDNVKSEIIRLYNEFSSLSSSESNKELMREKHILMKKSMDYKALLWAQKAFAKNSHFFKEPNEIDINRIHPVLINVEDDKKYSELFNIVRKTWSMPFNKGYGRRLRYVVFDSYHDAVIGIIGLQSPPADLSSRDCLFHYPDGKKLDLVNQTMDIYSLGSVPPYSQILGGKLVAGLAAASTIQEDYAKKYAQKRTDINDSQLESRLVALTTTSAFGRSSIYNRLKYESRILATPIGYTKGYGSIHLEPIYEDLKHILDEHGKLHTGGFGKGPKQKWQNINRALQLIGLPMKYARHGVEREVFLYNLVENLTSGMNGGEFGSSKTLVEAEYSEYWKSRWALPRAQRVPEWLHTSTSDYMLRCLNNSSSFQ